MDRSDEGEYICKALNTHGEHTARGVLRVQSTCPTQEYFKIYSLTSSWIWWVSSSLLFNWCFRYKSTSRSAKRSSEPSAGGNSRGWDFTVVLQGRWQSHPCPHMEEERWFTAATGEKQVPPVVIYPVTQLRFLGLWHWSYFALFFPSFEFFFHPVSWCLFRQFLLTVSISLKATVSMCYRDVLRSYRSVHLSNVCLTRPIPPVSLHSPSPKSVN